MLVKSWVRLPLSRGESTIVDLEDFYWLSLHKWSLNIDGSGHKTAVRTYWLSPTEQNRQFMHNIIAPTSLGVEIDHKNRDSLDNRRDNLRSATKAQNLHNTGPQKDNTSGYKGVSWWKHQKKWVAQLYDNKQRHIIGYFESKHEAARAYNEAAAKLHGEFAWLNEIKEV